MNATPWRAALAASLVLGAGAWSSAADAETGQALFGEHCAICHDATGAGVPGFGPPLVNAAATRVKTAGGREYLAQVVVHGISGVFESAGQRQFAAMTPQPKLSDAELAAVLNHVLGLDRGALPQNFTAIDAAEIAAARKVVRTPGELHATKTTLERAAR